MDTLVIESVRNKLAAKFTTDYAPFFHHGEHHVDTTVSWCPLESGRGRHVMDRSEACAVVGIDGAGGRLSYRCVRDGVRRDEAVTRPEAEH